MITTTRGRIWTTPLTIGGKMARAERILEIMIEVSLVILVGKAT
jgi:hypothetical protein